MEWNGFYKCILFIPLSLIFILKERRIQTKLKAFIVLGRTGRWGMEKATVVHSMDSTYMYCS
jgi:hypothetical protein